MTAEDEPSLDVDALITTIYGIQADLRLLVESLARERNPNVSDWSLLALVHLRRNLEYHTPSLRRH